MRETIKKYAGMPFSYPADCCQFVGECLAEIAGENPADVFQYKNKAEAFAIIERYGSLKAVLTSVFGPPQPFGEVALVIINGRETAAIVSDTRLIARTPSGLMDFPLTRAAYFWSIGHRD